MNKKMSRTEWFDEIDARHYAAFGRREAIRGSMAKWKQLVEACPVAMIDYNPTEMSCRTCSLCIKYDYKNTAGTVACNSCKLFCLKNNTWLKTDTTLRAWQDDSTDTNWKKWQRAARKMYNKIVALYKREYGRKK